MNYHFYSTFNKGVTMLLAGIMPMRWGSQVIENIKLELFSW
jgi:hypothetical protein